MNYSTNREVKNYLNEKYFGNLRDATVNNLLSFWESFVFRVEKEGDADEYWNDLTTREALEGITALVEPNEKENFLKDLQKIDDEFKTKTLQLKNPFREADEGKVYKGFWFNFRAPEILVKSENFKVSSE